MPESWYKITRPLNLSGYETDSFNADAQDSFDEMLGSYIARDVTIYEKRIYIPGLNTRAIIQNVTNDVLHNANIRQILCRIGTLHCGQYVTQGGNTWVVCTLPDENGIYEKAIMWLCKHRLRFVSPLTGDTVEYPVYSINSTQYGTGETKKPLMSIVDAQHLVYLPYNDETILFKNGFRFIMDKDTADPMSYRLTQVDSTSYSTGDNDGLIQWSVMQDQARDVDDVAEMIADNTPTEARRGNW
jgi:hypothetical protein